jgi:5S rRNA maturation endonuclease (ribonuclease M5)
VSVKNSRLAYEVEEIENVLVKLKDEVKRGIPVIVEGKKDVEALQRLDVPGSFIEIKSSKRSILNRLEHDVISEEVIIFTDFDRYGSELARDIHFRYRFMVERCYVFILLYSVTSLNQSHLQSNKED